MTKEEREFLIDLQKELNEQEHDCQAAPRFWTVGDYHMVSCREENAEDYEVFLPEDAETYKLSDLIQSCEDGDYDLSEDAKSEFENLKGAGEYEDPEEFMYWFKRYVYDDADLIPVKEEHFIRPNTMFLTKQEAKDHIEANYYHYSDRAHTYAMTAWRAPKVERLIEILEKTDFAK